MITPPCGAAQPYSPPKIAGPRTETIDCTAASVPRAKPCSSPFANFETSPDTHTPSSTLKPDTQFCTTIMMKWLVNTMYLPPQPQDFTRRKTCRTT